MILFSLFFFLLFRSSGSPSHSVFGSFILHDWSFLLLFNLVRSAMPSIPRIRLAGPDLSRRYLCCWSWLPPYYDYCRWSRSWSDLHENFLSVRSQERSLYQPSNFKADQSTVHKFKDAFVRTLKVIRSPLQFSPEEEFDADDETPLRTTRWWSGWCLATHVPRGFNIRSPTMRDAPNFVRPCAYLQMQKFCLLV